MSQDMSTHEGASDDLALSIRGLVKQFGDFRLGPLDLDLERGTVLAYIGPNGAGKTTTLHCVMGLMRSDAGEILVGGRRNETEHPAWKQDVGFVGEVQGHYQRWTVGKNLDFLSRFYRSWSSERASELAGRFDLHLDKKVMDLSRGNKTKLALVAALAHDPDLLILDEPTNGLDPVVRSEVLDVLWEYMEHGDKAILYSTHVLSDISRLADELVFLRDGHLVRRTTKDALTEGWRRFSFRWSDESHELPAIRGGHRQRSSAADHEVISSDHEETQAHLGELRAEGVQSTRLTLDEITIEILKEGHRAGPA
ncbi:MAG: ABC transporter ATP-binding protein [Thermoanaerobaculia bacterium]|nr:ABC transporter ATP-binding protein [Thermoanaerobaculia bacterium]